MGGFLPNGSVSSPNPVTLILTGTNDGSGLPGTTNLTIASQGAGLLEFSYIFTTLDDPGFENTGYLLGPAFPLADTSGESGSVIVPLSRGEIFGFSVGSVDDTGGAGVLTVTDFVGAGSGTRRDATPAGRGGGDNSRSVGGYDSFPTRRLAGLVLVVAAAACSIPTLLAQAQVYYSPSNVTGQLALVNIVNATQQAEAAQHPRLRWRCSIRRRPGN